MAIKVRPATLKDWPLLVRHRRAMFTDMGRGTPKSLDRHDREYANWARKLFRMRLFFGFIAMEGGKAIASGCIWLREKQPRPDFKLGPVPYLLSMFTEQEHRGKGAATAIVKATLAWAKKRKFPQYYLHASDAGRPVYERLGFTRTWEMDVKL